MGRSHPPTLLTIAKRALALCVTQGDTVIAAVSGGPDSMAMLHVLASLTKSTKIRVVAHGIDHGLRTEASSELDLAEALCARVSVPFTRTKLQLAPGGNMQARARAARHEALEHVRTVQGARFIATAHHADDRAETLLLRLLRGSSVAGLGVMPMVDGVRFRPLIEARKTDINLHLERHNIAFATDPSNTNSRYLRVRVRNELLPLLTKLNPRIVAGLTGLADEASRLPKGEPLPRAIRDAIRQLEGGKSSRKMRVLLPGGLVISREATNDSKDAPTSA